MLRYLRAVVCPPAPRTACDLVVGAAKFATHEYVRPTVIGGGVYTALDARALNHPCRLTKPHHFVQGSVTELPFDDDTLDVVLCSNTLTHVREPMTALREMCRCLKADRLAMLHTHREVHHTRSAAEHRPVNPHLGDDWFAEKGDEWVFREIFHRLPSVGWSVRMDQPSGDLSSAAHESDELKPGFELSVSCTSERATIGLLRLTLREARDLGTRVTGFALRAGQDCGSQAPLL